MKKVLALVLVAVLALGMGMSAFAADKATAFRSGYSLAGNNGNHENIALEGAPNYKQSTNSQTIALGNVFAMDEPVVYINLQARMFVGVDHTITTNNGTVYPYVDTLEFSNSGALFTTTTGQRPTSWNEANTMITRAADSTYASPTTLVAGLNPATLVKPATGDSTAAYDAWFNAFDALKVSASASSRQGEKLIQYTDSTSKSNALYFTYADGTIRTEKNQATLSDTRNLTSDEIRTSKITMTNVLKANSNTIKDIELRPSKGDIRMRLVDEWVNTGNKDFEAEIYISFDGKRAEDQKVVVTGNMRNPEKYVDSDHDSVDIGDGYVLVANDFNSKIAVNVGNGATIHTKLFKDKKYYGITTRDADEEADVVFRQYKDVDNVLTFKVVGLNSTYDYVTLSVDYSGYYVYDENMNYLGRGDEQLQFSKKFYLANRQLDIDSEYEEEDDTYVAPVTDPTTGGDGTASGNVNANPGTGR